MATQKLKNGGRIVCNSHNLIDTTFSNIVFSIEGVPIIKSRYLFFLICLFPLLLSAQFQDLQIPHCIGQYFRLNRGGPELLDVNIFEHPELGHTIRIRIVGRRNRSSQDLAYAFTSAAAVANLHGHIEMLWVEMAITYKDTEITQALAQADCTIDALIRGNYEIQEWLNKCLEFP